MKELLIKAHQQAALRDSSSTVILKAAFDSNGGDLIKSITAAMMTLGGLHAPIKHVYSMLSKMDSGREFLEDYEIIPGYGSSFCKTEDPILLDAMNHLMFNSDYKRVFSCHVWLASFLKLKKGIELYPNIAFFTAAYAFVEQKSILFCESILLEARIPVWIQILKEHHASQEEG